MKILPAMVPQSAIVGRQYVCIVKNIALRLAVLTPWRIERRTCSSIDEGGRPAGGIAFAEARSTFIHSLQQEEAHRHAEERSCDQARVDAEAQRPAQHQENAGANHQADHHGLEDPLFAGLLLVVGHETKQVANSEWTMNYG